MEPKTSIAALLGRVDFSPENVVEAAAQNSVLFVEAIQYRLACLEKKASAKLDAERERAECELDIRRQAKLRDEKLTEPYIASMVLVDKKVTAKAKALSEAEIYDAYSKLVVETFQMRRDCLQIVKGMVREEISQQYAVEAGAEKMRETRKKLRERFPGGQ